MTELEELPVELVPLDRLHLDPDNARKHGRRNLQALKESLHRFGQRKPVVATGDSVIRAGNGTLMAMQEMARENADLQAIGGGQHWRSITGIWVTWFPGSPEEARAYGITDNRTSDFSEWDNRLLLKQLEAVREHDEELLKAAGFEQTEWDELVEVVTREEARRSSFPPPEFEGQVPQTGMPELGDMYAGKGTRSLVFEYLDPIYVWVVERLGEYKEANDLPSNAATLLEIVAEVSGSAPPQLAAE